jgi:transcriptional coactivator HFI1/ADA1
VRTGEFKKKVEREERMVERGEIMRLGTGELPVEADERRRRKLLGMEDMRLALALGDTYLGQTPIIAGSIYNSRFLDTEGIEDLYALPTKPLTNGVSNGTNGAANGVYHVSGETWTVDTGDPMQIDSINDDPILNWQGGSVQDIEDLDSTLDDVLALADL